AEAGAEGVCDGVADRGDGRTAARFADAERREIGGGVDQLDQHLGHLAEAQHRVALPVARADAAGVEPHPSFKAQLAAWMMPPSSWLSARSGLITSPPVRAGCISRAITRRSVVSWDRLLTAGHHKHRQRERGG